MLAVRGRPFLEYIIRDLKQQGIEDILLLVGYLYEEIVKYFGDGSKFGGNIDYVIENKPAGTGGAVRLAKEKLKPVFLVLNGDTLTDINCLDLEQTLLQTDTLACIALRRVSDATRYGRVFLEKRRVVRFLEKDDTGPGIINSGAYAMRYECLAYIPSGTSSLEHDLFPVLAEKGQLSGNIFKGRFIDIGLPETYDKAETVVPKW